jgi:hypothetical protein
MRLWVALFGVWRWNGLNGWPNMAASNEGGFLLAAMTGRQHTTTGLSWTDHGRKSKTAWHCVFLTDC